ncbi:MAG TPA: type II secretion system protein, partial [Opitutaceae bacterium]|nr:type II secretion system protein [Opitutaceae bacterium]
MSAQRGFTLLEVLVALSIFALAAVVLGTAYVNVLNSYAVASRLNEGREEVSFARSLLLAEAELKKVEEGGEFDSVEQRRVRWTAKVEPTSTADLFQVSFVCDVTLPRPA